MLIAYQRAFTHSTNPKFTKKMDSKHGKNCEVFLIFISKNPTHKMSII